MSSSPEQMMAAVTESMRERTGRGLDEWVALVGASGVDPLDQNAVRRWLRDVRSEGRSTYVPFVRGRQFAAVASATAKRVDVGLRITDAAESSRLSSAKAPGQATHKVSLTAVGQVDAELIGLIRRAYEQSP
ncbi:DUF5655 domain-containing protein [Pengzhenrongella sp.]|uniref:DUF5655 domain-containing protein n=1 Tax=Pengzhenrongella sp. TaxID=2888820 RepID=UPI002F91C816